ncbi:MAG: exodeoxyribonuclease III [Halothiobacillaceae bacterium]|jgi:exodeoxyribonuclease-3|nr:exodeoxyribonuclease III [Halothiobacillaceae bacterium]MDY0050222.1 exodeoxyribonuclease III [Halothiobacillaceae bacterium]
MPILASWNVNSLKVRLPHLQQWLTQVGPDVLGLQETKTQDADFPREAIEASGYQVVFSGQKTYNGVALLSREPLSDVLTEVPGFDDPHRRVIAGTLGDTRIINLYVVNGEAVGSDKYAWKLNWLEVITRWIAEERLRYPKLAVMGDFNIAPDDRDVHDPAAWHEKILCSTPERAALQRLLDLGMKDTFRLFEQAEKSFSWWDYRAAGFRRNLGLRIDLILASDALAAECREAWIDRAPRGWERPSDHTPVLARFEAAP